jgi:hypothetical protein
MCDIIQIVVSFLSGSVAGGITGAIVTHILTKRREAEIRQLSKRKELTDFLAEWKAEVMTEHPHNLPVLYRGRLPRLRTKAVSVRDDLSGTEQTTFDELISNLSGLTPEQIIIHQNKGARDEIGQPLDALIGFLEQI